MVYACVVVNNRFFYDRGINNRFLNRVSTRKICAAPIQKINEIACMPIMTADVEDDDYATTPVLCERPKKVPERLYSIF